MSEFDFEAHLETENLILEPIVKVHAEKLFPILQALELYTFIPTEAPSSVEELRAKYTRWMKRGSDDSTEVWLNYAILDKDSNQYLGTLQATINSSIATNISYEVIPSLWRRGIGSEACKALLKILFKRFKVTEVIAYVDTRNFRSWKFLESLGFERIREVKNADFFKGRSSDEYVYSMEKPNFKL